MVNSIKVLGLGLRHYVSKLSGKDAHRHYHSHHDQQYQTSPIPGGQQPHEDNCDPTRDSQSEFKPESSSPEEIRDASFAMQDLERGTGIFEKVILSVQGMTCSGCEKKLVKAYGKIPTIRNTKTSLVLARAEFEVDITIISIEAVVAKLRRITNYKFERVHEDTGPALEVIATSDDASDRLKDVPGVLQVLRPNMNNSKLLRIHYDVAKVGPRDILEKYLPDLKLELAPPQAHHSLTAGKRQVRREGILFTLAAILTVPVVVIAWAPIPGRETLLYQATSLTAASLVQVGVAVEFYPRAFSSLFRSHVVEMDLLIVLSTTAAYVFSVIAFAYLVAGEPLETGSFFETSTLLATLILLGRFISELARQKATESVSVRSLQTQSALLISDDRNSIRQIDARLLQHGDVFRIMPHTSVVTDGAVVYGGSEVDESMVTGEPVPVAKALGSNVIAGSMNGGGSLDVRLTHLLGRNTISTIASMVDDAELTKPRTQAIADKIAGYFVPAIVALTLVVFTIWVLIGRYAQHRATKDSAVQALTYAIATLIISCPCAIGLAVPMVIVIASGVAAKHSVVFKSPDTIEVARTTKHVVFDKTGTLSQGCMTVSKTLYIGFDKTLTQRLLLGMVENVDHPVSASIAKFLLQDGVKASKFDSVKVVPGSGVEGYVHGSKLRAGNSRWLGAQSNTHVQAILQEGLTAFCVEFDSLLVAVFGLKDSPRPESSHVIRELQRRGITVHLLSGDEDFPVRAMARELAIDMENVRYRCSPALKRAYVQSLVSSHARPTVMFCGDGTNDAVALAQATLGVHINSGSATEIAKSAADIVLVRPDLLGVITAIDISKAAYRCIAFNFSWAALYNLFAILLAAGAFVRVRISPEFAGLGEICSVLPVVAIAFTMKFMKFGR